MLHILQSFISEFSFFSSHSVKILNTLRQKCVKFWQRLRHSLCNRNHGHCVLAEGCKADYSDYQEQKACQNDFWQYLQHYDSPHFCLYDCKMGILGIERNYTAVQRFWCFKTQVNNLVHLSSDGLNFYCIIYLATLGNIHSDSYRNGYAQDIWIYERAYLEEYAKKQSDK